jgi:transposase
MLNKVTRAKCPVDFSINIFFLGGIIMICVGIDVAKDKHDCFILSSEGEILSDVFTIRNNREGFKNLLQRIQSCTQKSDKIMVGLEATGHYSYNILGFLLDHGLPTCVINPLHTNLYRKSLSLRKTKTDRIDAKTIATMLMSDVDLKSYTDTAYHNEELKSLTRYRFNKVQERAKLKQSVARLVNILFPELEKLVPTLHMASVYALLKEFPGAQQVATAHLTHLKNLLAEASKGRYNKDKAIEIRDAARVSIGSRMPAKSLELRHTIQLISELDLEIDEIELAIEEMMNSIQSPITTIPGIGLRMGAMVLAEVGDFSNFDSPDKILAYAGLSPSTYESGKLSLAGTYSHMEKRGSRYLRYALFNATKFVCKWDSTFAAYLAKKRAEGKHYNVAISHAAKKLVRVIYALQKSGEPYIPAT